MQNCRWGLGFWKRSWPPFGMEKISMLWTFLKSMQAGSYKRLLNLSQRQGPSPCRQWCERLAHEWCGTTPFAMLSVASHQGHQEWSLQDRCRRGLSPSVRLNWSWGRQCERAPEQKQHPSKFTDESIEAPGVTHPKPWIQTGDKANLEKQVRKEAWIFLGNEIFLFLCLQPF